MSLSGGTGMLALAVVALAVSACDRGNGGAGASAPPGRLVVSAAASLKPALGDCSRRLGRAEVRLSFAGSDQLAAQIRRGLRPDVFAAADEELPRRLAAEGRVERPEPFAANQLVIALPAGSSRVRSLEDLGRPGARVALGSPSVPVGRYAQQVLERLGGPLRTGIEANVRSREPDVAGVVAKVGQRAVDAGFVYRTDVVAARPRLRALILPAWLQPRIRYAAAVVRGAPAPALARRYVSDLRSGACARALRRAGFTGLPRR